GGLALGLRPGTELRQADVDSTTAVRLRVTDVSGLSRATAEVMGGDPATLEAGDLFEVVLWVPTSGGALRMWMAPPLAYKAILAASSALKPLHNAPDLVWV